MPDFVDDRGVTIVYDVHEARTGAPRGVIHLLHGVGEHAGRYGAAIEELTGAGFIVYADDHRGHGRTGMKQHGTAAKLGRLGPGGLRAAADAVDRLGRIIRTHHVDLPIILLGHSWGSFLSQILLNEHPDRYAGVILTGSALRVPGSLNSGDLNKRWRGPASDGLEWLSTNPSIWKAFRADPLTTETPLLKLFGPLDALRLMGRPRKGLAEAGQIPLLLMVGSDDSVGGPRSVHQLADAYRKRSGYTDVTTLVYPGARHEIFNDVSWPQTKADLLAWLDAHFPRR